MSSSPEAVLPPDALSALRPDSVLIFPTETLYGIGCSAWRENAIARVFKIKGRAPDQPPPVLIADEDQLRLLAETVSPTAQLLMNAFWPGSLTLILPARREIPGALCGVNPERNIRTIGVRQTAHPVAATLCAALNAPLVATSANFTGAVGRAAQPQKLDDIPITLRQMVDVVVDGGAVGGAPSTIVDCLCHPPRVLRAGAIATKELQKILPTIQAI